MDHLDENFDPSKDPKYIFWVTTVHTNAFRQIFERLVGIVPDIPIAIAKGDRPYINMAGVNSTDLDNDDVQSSSSNSSKKLKRTKSVDKVDKKKKEEKNESSESDNESEEKEHSPEKKTHSKTESIDGDNSDGLKFKNTGGMRIVKLTDDNNVLIDARLEGHKFNIFYCKPNRHVIGIELETLNNFLKSIKNNSVLTIYMVEDDTNILYVKATSVGPNNKTISMEIKLIDIQEKIIQFKLMQFSQLIYMDTASLYQTCKDANMISSKIDISLADNTLTLSSKGENGSMRISFPCLNNKGIRVRSKNKKDIIRGTYELKYLQNFAHCGPLSPQIKMYMKKEKPLVLLMKLANLGKMYVFINSVDDEEDDD